MWTRARLDPHTLALVSLASRNAMASCRALRAFSASSRADFGSAVMFRGCDNKSDDEDDDEQSRSAVAMRGAAAKLAESVIAAPPADGQRSGRKKRERRWKRSMS